MRSPSPLPGLIFLIILVAGLGLAYATMSPASPIASFAIAGLSFIVASIVAMRSRLQISGSAWWC